MTTKSLLFLSLILAGCDVGDASPLCQMQVVGAQPSTPAGKQPWVALWITGDGSCLDGVAEDLRVSMYETSPAAHYRGDAVLTSAQPVGKTAVCAVYKWPVWENDAAHWSVIVTPPARTSVQAELPRALGLAPSQVEGFVPGSVLPFWLVDDAFELYLPNNSANCWPGGA
jgi:hypothetical protein